MNKTDFACEDAYHFMLPEENPPFWVSMAGISYCDENYRIKRDFSAYTIIEYVCSGTGTLWMEEEEFHPSKGDIYILTEKSKHSYCPDRNNPWTKIFINLQGTAVSRIVKAFDLHKKVVYNNCQYLEPIFREILETLKKDADVDQVMEECSMLFMKLLNKLCLHELREQNIPDEMRIVKRFIDYNYRKNLSMDDISAVIYRSNDYVKKQFKQYYGVTPYAYYLDVKMAHAKCLLQRTNLPIKQIADRLGYKSDRYFSKRFSEIMGITATQYRKNEKNEK